MKPNYDEMTRAELKDYVLKHREDQDALDALMKRRSPDSEATWYKFEDSQSVQEILRQKLNGEN